ncbi:MAG: GNAT family N-acetyltransferase, partial [Paracoccaceae bacterium]
GDEAEILTIAVSGAARRRGVGSALLRLFEPTARARGVRTLLLEVAQSNAGALAFYRAHHFEQRGRRPAYYRATPQNRVDALIMGKSLA